MKYLKTYEDVKIIYYIMITTNIIDDENELNNTATKLKYELDWYSIDYKILYGIYPINRKEKCFVFLFDNRGDIPKFWIYRIRETIDQNAMLKELEEIPNNDIELFLSTRKYNL
jgi:hypothetical protein